MSVTLFDPYLIIHIIYNILKQTIRMISIMQDYLNPFAGSMPTLQGQLIQVRRRGKPRGAEPAAVVGQEQQLLLDYCVYLPPNYDTSKKYAILYHLHGAGELFFMMKKEVTWMAAQLEQADVQMIIAAPADPTHFSMWADGTNIDMASKLHDEFIPHIEETYRVKKERSSRFLQGFSMGGFGAALHGFKYQDKFAKVVIWDGALHDWDTLCQSRAFIAKAQFQNRKENFDAWSPWEAVKESSSSSDNNTKNSKSGSSGSGGRLVQERRMPPVLMFVGSMPETNDYGNKFKIFLEEKGVNVSFVKTELLHSMKRFSKEYGQQAIEFFLQQQS